ncbi:hypothetical protein OAT79_00035 [Gammaproteobacteria bacterium]|nr:hypothetical protein [Gammaproteobacteria bacterium]
MQTQTANIYNILVGFVLPFFIGILLIATSFTSLRFAGSGPIEILLLFALALFLFFKLLEKSQFHYAPFVSLLYLLIFMAPITFLNTYDDILGSSTRTLYALIYGSFIGFIAANTSHKDQEYIAYGVISILIVIDAVVIFQYDFNDMKRLLFLSENPNQIALTALGAMFVIAMGIEDIRLIVTGFIAALIYGSLALSDSYFVSIFILSSFMFLKIILQGKLFLIIGLLWLTLLLISWPLAFPDSSYVEPILDLWSSADEGGGRVTLAINGITAFLSSPIFGHGAGAFSGTEIPFMRFEAHNTLIDFLTMGGLIWALIVYVPFFLAAQTFFLENRFLLLGSLMAIIAFSLFHFIGRHPIFWVIWGYCLFIQLENRRAN